MKRTGTGRVLATIFIGILFGIFRHFQQMRQLGRGRESFLAEQGRYFDKITQYHEAVTMVVAGVILAAVAVGLYEVIAAGFTRLVPPTVVEE